MKFSELKKSLNSGVELAYIIEGEDAYLRESAYSMLKGKYLQSPELNLNNFSGSEVKEDAETFLTAIESYPFMSEKRFVVVRDYYPTNTDLKNKVVKRALTSNIESTVLIIINENKCEPLHKLNIFTVVDCSKLDSATITKWLRNKCQKADLLISNETCELIYDYTLGDMSKVNSEIEKLISYSLGEKEVTKQAVESVCKKDTEYQIFAFTDFVANGNKEKAYESLMVMLNGGEDEHHLFISIYYHFRKMFYSLISTASESELAKSLQTPEFVIRKAKSQAKKFTPKRLKSIVEKLAVYDMKFKSGELTINDVLFNSILNIIMGVN